MTRIFRIAVSSKIEDFHIIGEKTKVSEDLFWQTVESKVKEITNKQPEKFKEILSTAKQHLLQGKFKNSKQNLTILDTWFEIQGTDNI